MIPIVVTGGDHAHGEVIRGEVLLIHFDEAEVSADYANDALGAADAAHAPRAIIDSLVDIMVDNHWADHRCGYPGSFTGHSREGTTWHCEQCGLPFQIL